MQNRQINSQFKHYWVSGFSSLNGKLYKTNRKIGKSHIAVFLFLCSKYH